MSQIEQANEILKDAALLCSLLDLDADSLEQNEELQSIAKSRRELAKKIRDYNAQHLARQFTLRQMTMEHVMQETNQNELPIVHSGSIDELHNFAKSKGMLWKNSKKNIFGGYYFQKIPGEESTCFLIV